ncbi:MAG TPA: cyclophilin-like fold protein [Mycobacterium sp.]|nr:cyclophilin-like fold protein [Mycobacterium sp.]
MNDLDIRPRTRLSRAAALIPTTAAVLLATTLAVGTFDRVGPTTSPAPSVTQPAADSSGGTQVVLRLSDGTATATLNDTAAAQEFAALLPVQLTLRDPMGQAKSGRLPSPLPVADADRVIDPEVAGLYYWPPSGDIGIVYDDLGQTVPPPGMVQLGTRDQRPAHDRFGREPVRRLNRTGLKSCSRPAVTTGPSGPSLSRGGVGANAATGRRRTSTDAASGF